MSKQTEVISLPRLHPYEEKYQQGDNGSDDEKETKIAPIENNESNSGLIQSMIQISSALVENEEEERHEDPINDVLFPTATNVVQEEEEEVNEPEEPPIIEELKKPAPPPRTATTKKGKSPRRFGARKISSSPDENSSEKISVLTDKFLNGEPVNEINPMILAQTVVQLEAKRDELMISGSFAKSMKAQRAVDQAKTAQFESCKKQSQQEVLDEIAEKRNSLDSEYKRFKNEMKEREEDLDNGIKTYLNGIKTRHQEELQEFDDEWHSDTQLRRYNRSSAKLRALRHQQHLYMNVKRFDDAAQVCKIADQLQKEEAKESYRRMLNAYLTARELLVSKQTDEYKNAMMNAERKRDEFKYLKNNLERPFIKRIKNLEIEEEIAQDPDRIWNLKHRNDGDTISLLIGQRSTRNAIAKPANVTEFNTLKLPPLPISQPNPV